jgi:hypothetical protein
MSLRPVSTTVSATALAALMLFTAGCSGSDPAEKAGSSKSPAGSSGSSPAPQQKDAVDSGAAAAGIDSSNPPKAIASVTSSVPYSKDPKATAKFDIYSVRRQGKLAIMTLSVTPKFSSPDPAALFTLMGAQFFSPTMVDPVNLRAYGVVSSGSGNLATSAPNAQAFSGQPMFVWAAFAAPPANVEKVNLTLFDTLPAITDVPLS